MRHVRPAPTTAAAGPVPDFDTFFAIEYRRLFEVLYLLTRDRAEAEDLAQEAMARAYERWSRIATLPGMCTAPPSTSTAHSDGA